MYAVAFEAKELTTNAKQSIKTLLGSAQEKPFKQIQDPLAWQISQRDEWT